MSAPPPELASSFDVVVLGAGAGGMSAAAVAASRGLATLLVEKTAYVGGTTALSGGMVWVPNSSGRRGPPGAGDGEDSPERARAYLEATVGDAGDRALWGAYLERAAEAIDYLGAKTDVRLVPVGFYPDYYPDAPGATLGGRVMEPLPFDARALGPDFARLRPPLPEFTLLGGMMVARPDLVHFRNAFRSPRSAVRVARLLARHARDRARFPRGAHLVLGNALAARLLKSVLAHGVDLWTGTRVERLVVAGGRVAGVEVRRPDGRLAIGARRGVVLATGGFSHDPGLRAELLPPETGPLSAAAPGDSGDGLGLGREAGGRICRTNPSNAFWVPVSRFTRPDGSAGVFPHTVTDRGKPGMLAVNQAGERFTNEAESYHEFVLAMFRTHNRAATIPSYLVCDRRALWRYGLGAVRPMTLRLAPYTGSGYLIEAATLAALAERLEVSPERLAATVARYSADARRGEDGLFGRGSNAYHRYVGDPARRPNPCMAPLETPPFYAVALYPADLGTAAGLVTDAAARVLDGAGAPVPGLHACGNDMNSVMGGRYPGPGITLGPALVFGYLAATALADQSPSR